MGVTVFEGVSLEATLTTEAHDRRVAARTLREFGPQVQEELACDPEEECAEGTCTECDLLFAVQSAAADRADSIEREAGERAVGAD